MGGIKVEKKAMFEVRFSKFKVRIRAKQYLGY